MKLLLPLLLLALALCCNQAEAMVCPHLAVTMGNFFMMTDPDFLAHIMQFKPTPEMVASVMQVKSAMWNELQGSNRDHVMEVLGNLLLH